MTYHTVDRKQTYAMPIGVRSVVRLRDTMLATTSINENMVGTLSVIVEEEQQRLFNPGEKM